MKKPMTREVKIPPIPLARVEVVIQGITPLRCNRFREDAIKGIEDKQQKVAKIAKAARDPKAEFEGSIHKLPNGKFGFPAIGIKLAMVTAAGRFADEKMTEMLGSISIEADLIEIEGPKPRMSKDMVVLSSGMKKICSVAYRPCWDDWKMTVPISYLSNKLSVEQVLNILQYAGTSVGIGSWRVEKKGTGGQFRVIKARAMDETAAVAAVA
jgi:hypothetical protein